MNRHTKKRHEWNIVFRDRGQTFDPDGAYVLESDRAAGTVTLDTDHPDYPPKPTQPEPQPRPPLSPPGRSREQLGRERWAWFHDVLSKPIAFDDRPELARKFRTMANGLGGCTCESHWQGILSANPVDWADPVAWGVRVHNLVNATLGRRADWTVEQARGQHQMGVAAP